MPIDLRQILTGKNPIRNLLTLAGSPLEKLAALNTLFSETEQAKLQCLFTPDTSFLASDYDLMDYLIDSLQEESNPEDQKNLLVNTISFIKNNTSIFAHSQFLNPHKFFTVFFALYKLLNHHKASLPPILHTRLQATLFDIADDYIQKINLACIKILDPDQLLHLLHLIKNYYLEQQDETRLYQLVDSIYEHIRDLNNNSHYTFVAFELIQNYPLRDLQLATLISFKEMIKAKLRIILAEDDPDTQKGFIKQTFCLDENNQTSQLYLFFMLQQQLTFFMLAENNYEQFRIVDELLSNNTKTLCIIKEMTIKHPDLILEIVLNSKEDYQLFLLKDSQIKMAVVNYIIKIAKSIGFDEKEKGRALLRNMLMIHEDASSSMEKHKQLYRYLAIPQNAKAPINGIELEQEKITRSLTTLLKEAKKYNSGAHLSATFQPAQPLSIELQCLSKPSKSC